MIGGALLMNSFRGMFGGHPQQSFYDQPGPGPGTGTPWAPSQSDSDLARQAGIDDIGRGPRSAAYDDGPQRAGLFDNDVNNDNFDVADSGDIGGDVGGGDV